MLNIFDFYSDYKKEKYNYKNNYKKSYKHFPSSTREWKNSIYVYNKNSEKLIPSTSELVTKYIKSYFNLYNKRLEFKMRTRKLLLRLRRLSSNRFYVSNEGFKHTNNKVCINLHVFNRQKNNYLLTLKKWFLNHMLTKPVTNSKKEKTNINKLKQINLLGKKGKWVSLNLWKKRNIMQNNRRKIIKIKGNKININSRIIRRMRGIDNKGIEKLLMLNKNKNLFLKVLNALDKGNIYSINKFKSVTSYTENFYKNLIKKSLRKIRMYFYYRQLIIINKSKLNYTYLQYLKRHMENIYNKNVEFNIININKFYLNSNILSETIAIKLAKNRRKLLKYLTKLKDKVVLKKRNIIAFDKPKKDMITRLELSKDDVKLRRYILNSLKYRHVTGFRLEAKGRLSRRFTASRSVSKLKYKGNLLELDSSNRGWSSVLLKGSLRSNTQFTKLKSKSRIGSFGIKGWISGN